MTATIFDLDGTLLDTLGDLADSMNAALARLGAPGHPVDAYRTLVGDGVETLARRALPDGRRDPGTVRACVAAMREEYGLRWAATTRPYAGIPEALGDLVDRGVRLAVLSNKPDDFTRMSVERFFPADLFAIVRGARPGAPVKPDPAAALDIARDFGVAPAEILYFGDTNTDMRTANAAGMVAIGVAWGFRDAAELRDSGARRVLSHPREIPGLIGGR